MEGVTVQRMVMKVKTMTKLIVIMITQRYNDGDDTVL